MANRPHRRSPTCAYCGAPATTRDHIPGRAFFPDATGLQLITVPSCTACNNGAALDDEYFRDTVVQYHQVSDRPAAEPLIQRMLRSLQRPEQVRYAQARLRSLQILRTSTGSPQPAFRIDPARLERVATRYIRGLHQFDLRRPVAPTDDVHVLVHPEHINEEQERFYGIFGGGVVRSVKEDTFWYVRATPQDHPTASAWLLIFFEAFPVFGYVRPRTT